MDNYSPAEFKIAVYQGVKLAMDTERDAFQGHLETLARSTVNAHDRMQRELRFGVWFCFLALCVIAWRVW